MKALSIISRFRGVAHNHRVKLYLQQHCLNLASEISNQLLMGQLVMSAVGVGSLHPYCAQ